MMVWISRRVPQRLPAQSGVTLTYLNANEYAGGIMNYSYSIDIHYPSCMVYKQGLILHSCQFCLTLVGIVPPLLLTLLAPFLFSPASLLVWGDSPITKC